MKYFWIIGVIYACVFFSYKIYAFVYDVEPSTHIINEYIDYTNTTNEPMSFADWQQHEDEKVDRFLDRCADEWNSCFDPNWESAGSPHHNIND